MPRHHAWHYSWVLLMVYGRWCHSVTASQHHSVKAVSQQYLQQATGEVPLWKTPASLPHWRWGPGHLVLRHPKKIYKKFAPPRLKFHQYPRISLLANILVSWKKLKWNLLHNVTRNRSQWTTLEAYSREGCFNCCNAVVVKLEAISLSLFAAKHTRIQKCHYDPTAMTAGGLGCWDIPIPLESWQNGAAKVFFSFFTSPNLKRNS